MAGLAALSVDDWSGRSHSDRCLLRSGTHAWKSSSQAQLVSTNVRQGVPKSASVVPQLVTHPLVDSRSGCQGLCLTVVNPDCARAAGDIGELIM